MTILRYVTVKCEGIDCERREDNVRVVVDRKGDERLVRGEGLLDGWIFMSWHPGIFNPDDEKQVAHFCSRTCAAAKQGWSQKTEWLDRKKEPR